MLEIINNTETVKARKDHNCSYCEGVIKAGTEYEKTVLKHDGDVYTWKSHLHCQQLISLCNIEAYDEGITHEDFCEGIEEYMQFKMSYSEVAKMLYEYLTKEKEQGNEI